MSSAEVRVVCLNDFGFDEGDVLAGLVLRVEVPIAFDPGARENTNVGHFNERTTRLRCQEDTLDGHGYAPLPPNAELSGAHTNAHLGTER